MDSINIIVICLAVAALAISVLTIIVDIAFFRIQVNMARTTMRDSREMADETKSILNEIRISQNITGQQVKDQYDKLLEAAIHGSSNPVSEAATSAVALQELKERVTSLAKSISQMQTSDQVNNEVKEIKQTIANLSNVIARFASGVVVEQKREGVSRFERFTEEARKALTISQELAITYHSSNIDIEHILLATLKEKTFRASKVINSMGVSIEKVVEAVSILIPRESGERREMNLSKRAKDLIDLAMNEAYRLNSKWIGTEHLLMGCLLVGGATSEVLSQYGINIERIRTAALQIPPP
jgi:hypothetical protein